MADSQNGFPFLGFANSLRAINGGLGTNSGMNTIANYGSVAALRGALNTANATYYTTSRLDTMTVNDMIWALRSIQDPTTIHDKMPASTA